MRGVQTGFAARVAARRWAGMVRARVQQRLGQLRAVVNAAAEIKGRKVLVVITESMPLEPGKEAFTAYNDVVSVEALESLVSDPAPSSGTASVPFADWTNMSVGSSVDWVSLRPLVLEIGRNAATNGITIYSVQPEYGLALLGPGGDIGATIPGRDAVNPAQQRRSASSARLAGVGRSTLVEHMTTNTESALRPLAEMTGGGWYRGGLSLDEMSADITSDVQSYYSLGYRASEVLDRPHRIEVRVKGRPDLHVRTRQEVLRKSPAREMTDRVVASLLDPEDSNELEIRVEAKIVGTAVDRSYKTVWVATRVPLSKLTFLPDGDTLKAQFSVHYAAAGEETDFVSGMHGEQVVQIPSSEFEQKKNEVWTYVVPMNLRPARHTISIGVLDQISNLSGFGTLEIDVK
jgi:hypothetical protein